MNIKATALLAILGIVALVFIPMIQNENSEILVVAVYFMSVLVLAVMYGMGLNDSEIESKSAIMVCGFLALAFGIIGVLSHILPDAHFPLTRMLGIFAHGVLLIGVFGQIFENRFYGKDLPENS